MLNGDIMEVRIAIHRHSETEMLATIFLPIISYLSWLSLLLVSAGITGKSLHRRMKSWVRGKEGEGGEGWEREMGNFFVGHIAGVRRSLWVELRQGRWGYGDVSCVLPFVRICCATFVRLHGRRAFLLSLKCFCSSISAALLAPLFSGPQFLWLLC